MRQSSDSDVGAREPCRRARSCCGESSKQQNSQTIGALVDSLPAGIVHIRGHWASRLQNCMDGPSQPVPVEQTRFCRPPHAWVHTVQSLHWPETGAAAGTEGGTATLAAAVSMPNPDAPWAEAAARAGAGAAGVEGAEAAFAVACW